MAKEVAVLKRAKISQAQQYMILAVLGAAVVFGVALALSIFFGSKIAFNNGVIAEEEKTIVIYSKAIQEIGVCTKPKGEIYTDEELRKCNPNTVSTASVQDTLRSNILENMAKNEALASVPNEDASKCVSPKTKKNYTYEELQELYNSADTDEKIASASNLIQSCSSLRVIPDALPVFKNEEALLASLNKLFNAAGLEPESLSPTNTTDVATFGTNLNTISLRLAVEAEAWQVEKLLDNIERSIRDFSIERATIEWQEGQLNLQAQANAFYMDPSILGESTTTITSGATSNEN